MIKTTVQLNLTPEVFLVVYEFLYSTKLGDRNDFETAISDFMSENPELDEVAANLSENYGDPELSVSFSESDGMVFSVQ